MVLDSASAVRPAAYYFRSLTDAAKRTNTTPEVKMPAEAKQRLALDNIGADGETRTRTAFATTPSR
ncbi:protein of unknown function [Paraburkholderia kururiensis]